MEPSETDRLDEFTPKEFTDKLPAALADASPATKYVWWTLASWRVLPESDTEWSPTVVVEKTQLSASSVSHILGELCEADLAASRPDPRDARRTLYRARWPVDADG